MPHPSLFRILRAMRQRYHDMMMKACVQREVNLLARIDRLERELDRERADHRRLLERLAGVDPEPVIEMGASPPLNRDSRPEENGRPVWAEPEPGQWSPDGLSSSLDDDPTDLDELPPYLPEDYPAPPEPLPEVEGRERTVGIAPGEDPFRGLVGLDPHA